LKKITVKRIRDSRKWKQNVQSTVIKNHGVEVTEALMHNYSASCKEQEEKYRGEINSYLMTVTLLKVIVLP
jgi:hypothetical protein